MFLNKVWHDVDDVCEDGQSPSGGLLDDLAMKLGGEVMLIWWLLTGRFTN